MKEKEIKGAVLRHSCNVERLIEHIRKKVAAELSCECWHERNVKWTRNVSSES